MEVEFIYKTKNLIGDVIEHYLINNKIEIIIKNGIISKIKINDNKIYKIDELKKTLINNFDKYLKNKDFKMKMIKFNEYIIEYFEK